MHLNDHGDENISEILLYMTSILLPKDEPHVTVIIHFNDRVQVQMAPSLTYCNFCCNNLLPKLWSKINLDLSFCSLNSKHTLAGLSWPKKLKIKLKN